MSAVQPHQKNYHSLSSAREQAKPIDLAEYHQRLQKVRGLMQEAKVDVLYLDATTSLRYFTGMKCYASERLHGALISVSGELIYICPAFEVEKTRTEMLVEGDFAVWEEHEDPTSGGRHSGDEVFGLG